MKKETYGNKFRSGEKNIDDLYKSLIKDITDKSREDTKFNYVIQDVFQLMKDLGWSGDDTFKVEVDSSSLEDKFIIIKNNNKQKMLPESNLNPIII